MKKLLRFADCFVLLGAILGCLLRFWLRNAVTAGAHVQAMTHPSWLLLYLLSALVVAFVYLVTRHAGDEEDYGINFPKSLLGGAAKILLAILLGYQGITGLVMSGDALGAVTGVLAMVAAVCLAVGGIERISGNQPVFFVHMLPCVYFVLRLFDMGRDLGSQPEVHTFLFTFVGSVCLAPAYYWMWSFDVGQGNRRRSLFWSLTATFFCLVATLDNAEGWLLYLVHGAVLLSNLCLLQPLEAAALPEEAVEETTEEAPVVPEEVIPEEVIPEEMPQQAEAPKAKPVLHKDIDPETDMEAFLEDLKLFLEEEDR